MDSYFSVFTSNQIHIGDESFLPYRVFHITNKILILYFTNY